MTFGFTDITLYLIIWWTVIFMMLPLGMHREDSRMLADSRWTLKRKFLATTAITTVLYIMIKCITTYTTFSFQS